MPRPPLDLTPDQMRALGYGAVDALIDRLHALPGAPPARFAERTAMEALLREPLPRAPQDPLAVLDRATRDVLQHAMSIDHPRFFAFVPAPSNFVSVMADTLAAGFNVFAGTWMAGAGPAQVELVVLDWLRDAVGLPGTAGGLCTSGGSMANLNALAAARYARLNDDMTDAVAYGSDQTHSSIARAFRVLGFGPDQFRRLPSDDSFRLAPDTLRAAVQEDLDAGRRPFCVVATPGTINTGAVEPLAALADVCAEFGLWLHADGAYGAAAALSQRGRTALAGLERVDSLTLDPHKWLFQPYEIGCLLVRDRRHLRGAFQTTAEYLEDAAASGEEVNFADYGPQLTRSFRALKLWMSLQVFGADAFEAAIDRGFALAELAEACIRATPGLRIVTPAQMAVVTFQATPRGLDADATNAHNRALVEAILADGQTVVVSTRLRDRTVLRLCPINPRTTDHDVRTTITRIADLSAALAM